MLIPITSITDTNKQSLASLGR